MMKAPDKYKETSHKAKINVNLMLIKLKPNIKFTQKSRIFAAIRAF